jgi:hypothetical protein
MPDTKITDLTTGTVLAAADWLVYVDVSDTTMAASGTDKKLSPAVLTAGLLPFVASGSSHAQGLVPDPGASAGTTRFLREDATWQTPAGGGGGTPGGTSGQIQYNNAGAFGGYTMGGDGTLVTSTGVLTVTKTSGVAFAASATTDTTNAANISSGTLPVARLPTTGLAVNQHTSAITADTDGTTITFNLATSDWHSVTLGGNRTLAVSNEGTGQQFTIVLVQDATGSRLVTWFSGIKWVGGSVPTLTTTAGKADVFTFKQIGAGSYYGFVAGQNH